MTMSAELADEVIAVAVEAAVSKFSVDRAPREQPNGSFYSPDALLKLDPEQWVLMSHATADDVAAWLINTQEDIDRLAAEQASLQRKLAWGKVSWQKLRDPEHAGWSLSMLEELYGPIAQAGGTR